LPLDHHGEFDRIVQRGLALARPPEVEEESEEDEPEADTPVDVRPNLGPFTLPSVADLSAEQVLAIASDPRETKKRLRELQKTIAAVSEASEKLATARAQFDAGVEKTQAELAAKSEALQKGNLKLFVDRRAFEETAERARKVLAEQARRENVGRFEQVGPTLVREFVPGYPRGDERTDAHYTPIPDHTFAPAGGHTLTKEPELVRPARRRARRSAEL
jgi:hypothetical protein